VSPNQLDKFIFSLSLGVTISISLKVSKIANMTVRISRSTMFLAKGIDCKPRLALNQH
jgi:hypothetical protein